MLIFQEFQYFSCRSESLRFSLLLANSFSAAHFSRLLRRLAKISDLLSFAKLFRTVLLFSPLRQPKPPSSAHKDFRSALLFSPLRSRTLPSRLAKSLYFQFQFFEPFTTFLAAQNRFAFLRGSQSRMRLGKENKPGLVFFSLSFVFGRFESKLSSGLQLRIKNQANLFYLRSPFTTFAPL